MHACIILHCSPATNWDCAFPAHAAEEFIRRREGSGETRWRCGLLSLYFGHIIYEAVLFAVKCDCMRVISSSMFEMVSLPGRCRSIAWLWQDRRPGEVGLTRLLPRDAMLAQYMQSSCVRPSVSKTLGILRYIQNLTTVYSYISSSNRPIQSSNFVHR